MNRTDNILSMMETILELPPLPKPPNKWLLPICILGIIGVIDTIFIGAAHFIHFSGAASLVASGEAFLWTYLLCRAAVNYTDKKHTEWYKQMNDRYTQINDYLNSPNFPKLKP